MEPNLKTEMADISEEDLLQMTSSALRKWLHLHHVHVPTKQSKDYIQSLALDTHARLKSEASMSSPITTRRRSIRNQKSSDESNRTDLSNHQTPLRRSSISTRSTKAIEVDKRPINIIANSMNSFLSNQQNNPNPKTSLPLREITGNNNGSKSALPINHIAKNVTLTIDQTRQRERADSSLTRMGSPNAKAKAKEKHEHKPVSPSVSKKLKVVPDTKEEEADGDEKGGDGHVGHEKDVDEPLQRQRDENVDVDVDVDVQGHEHGQVYRNGHVDIDRRGHGNEHVDIQQHVHGNKHVSALGDSHGNEHVDVQGHGHGNKHVSVPGHGDDSRIRRLKRSGNLIISHVNERVFKRLKMVPSRIHVAATTARPRTTLLFAMCVIMASMGVASYWYHLKKLKEQQARSRKWW